VTFAAELRNSLHERTIAVPVELAVGEPLGDVLERHLVAVESAAETVLLTSILLLDEERKRLRHAAAPSLPRAYCDAIDGGEIGPAAGSCGTAAYLGRAIYVTDIETDPLWRDYRHVALEHGLRACWSTPIHDSGGGILGTFAVYHLAPRSPTRQEVDAIAMISDHVAQAIEWSRAWPNDRTSLSPGQPTLSQLLSSIEADFEKLARNVEQAIERGGRHGLPADYLGTLARVKKRAHRGAMLARRRARRG
jgi:GAF domain-containing protein